MPKRTYIRTEAHNLAMSIAKKNSAASKADQQRRIGVPLPHVTEAQKAADSAARGRPKPHTSEAWLLVDAKRIGNTEIGSKISKTKLLANGTGDYLDPRCDRRNNAWRNSVLTRDGNACTRCGITQDELDKRKAADPQGNTVRCNAIYALHVHHIKKWEEHPELRFDVDNGLTLCQVCHNLVEPRFKSV